MTGTAAACAFLGHAFLKPDAAALSALAEDLNQPEARRALGDSQGTLEVDYNRLFLNPGGTPCPPWQSAHAAEPRLMGAAHLSALEWFRRYDVEPSATNDPADHVGLLLLFYAQLLDSGEDAETLALFREQHLGWIPAFCDCVEQHTRHPFYRLAAVTARSLVTSDHY